MAVQAVGGGFGISGTEGVRKYNDLYSKYLVEMKQIKIGAVARLMSRAL